MPDNTLCSFDAVLTEDNNVNFGKLADENPDLFRFIYSRSVEEIRKTTAQHIRVKDGILAYGGPLSEFLGGRTTKFYSGIFNEWLHGIAARWDYFHIGGDSRSISRGVRHVGK